MKNEKDKLIRIGIAMALVFAGVVTFGLIIARKSDFGLQEYIWIGIVLLVLIISLVVFVSQWKDVKKGLPLKDERSKQVLNLAASRAFYVTLYWLLAISMLERFFAGFISAETLTASQTAGGGILGMAIIFLIFWLYYNKKGNLE